MTKLLDNFGFIDDSIFFPLRYAVYYKLNQNYCIPRLSTVDILSGIFSLSYTKSYSHFLYVYNICVLDNNNTQNNCIDGIFCNIFAIEFFFMSQFLIVNTFLFRYFFSSCENILFSVSQFHLTLFLNWHAHFTHRSTGPGCLILDFPNRNWIDYIACVLFVFYSIYLHTCF